MFLYLFWTAPKNVENFENRLNFKNSQHFKK
jgi:hypothetical protein